MSRGPYSKEEDPILWLMRELCDVLPPGVERTNALLRVEQQARIHWGGKRPYIAMRSRQDVASALKRKRDGSE